MKEQFILHGWMSSALRLRGNELLVFAYIFDDIDRDGYCVASLYQIAQSINVSVDTARTLTNNLANYNMITKDKYYNKDNRVVGCIYKLSDYFVEFLYKEGIWYKEECNNE